MKTKLSAVALVASAVTIAQANPGGIPAAKGASHRRRSCTQCPGGSRSDAARWCFIVRVDADAVIRQ